MAESVWWNYALCSIPIICSLTAPVNADHGNTLYSTLLYHKTTAGGGKYKCRAQCPRMLGLCLDLASPTRGGIGGSLYTPLTRKRTLALGMKNAYYYYCYYYDYYTLFLPTKARCVCRQAAGKGAKYDS